jgi:hypothetical protein
MKKKQPILMNRYIVYSFSSDPESEWKNIWVSNVRVDYTCRAVERAWKAWQFHGARTRKRGPKITKTKEKHDNQKKFSYFGPQICKLREPQNSQALGWPNQSIQKWTCKRGGARKHCFHGARPGSPRSCIIHGELFWDFFCTFHTLNLYNFLSSKLINLKLLP